VRVLRRVAAAAVVVVVVAVGAAWDGSTSPLVGGRDLMHSVAGEIGGTTLDGRACVPSPRGWRCEVGTACDPWTASDPRGTGVTVRRPLLALGITVTPGRPGGLTVLSPLLALQTTVTPEAPAARHPLAARTTHAPPARAPRAADQADRRGPAKPEPPDRRSG
jgi:hypothetical protein